MNEQNQQEPEASNEEAKEGDKPAEEAAAVESSTEANTDKKAEEKKDDKEEAKPKKSNSAKRQSIFAKLFSGGKKSPVEEKPAVLVEEPETTPVESTEEPTAEAVAVEGKTESNFMQWSVAREYNAYSNLPYSNRARSGQARRS